MTQSMCVKAETEHYRRLKGDPDVQNAVRAATSVIFCLCSRVFWAWPKELCHLLLLRVRSIGS